MEVWAEKMRRKMEGHEMAPPEGLWDGIKEQMGFSSQPARKRMPLLWWCVAAASVLALVGFFALSHQKNYLLVDNAPSHHEAEPSVSQTEETVPSSETTIPNQNLAEYIKEPQPQQSSVTPYQHSELQEFKSNEKKDHEEALDNKEEVLDDNKEALDNDEALKNDNALQKEEKTKTVLQVYPKSYDVPSQTHISYTESAHHSDLGKWSLGVNMSGGLLAAQNTTLVNPNIGFSNEINKTALYANDSNILLEHRPPLRFGLSAQWQINRRLALVSGLNYTFLYSKPKFINDKAYEKMTLKDQKLHYLGIPIGLAYQLWSAKRFHFYISGSTMLEKCLNEHPWQWSVNAAAGAEYDITSQMGCYFEPSLGYYFDDGSSLKHYYKEHPWAPSFELGIRLHIGNEHSSNKHQP